jgi:hypothetical protein
MSQSSGRKTIFEFLTKENPEVWCETPKNKSLTGSKRYHLPKQLTLWNDFTIKTFHKIYESSLYQESLRRDYALPDYPTLLDDECNVYHERNTCTLFTTWNRYIVNAALHAVKDVFHTSRWSDGMPIPENPNSTDVDENDGEEEDEDEAPRARKGKARYADPSSKKKKRKPLDPDAGATYWNQSGIPGRSEYVELLPKDYKTASKWESSAMLKRLDDLGYWRDGASWSPEAMPIRQVYTYCVKTGCRYGCILTTNEAFIFRIRPRSKSSGKPWPPC